MGIGGGSPTLRPKLEIKNETGEKREQFAAKFLAAVKKSDVQGEFEGTRIDCEKDEMTSQEEVFAAIEASKKATTFMGQLASGAFNFKDADVLLNWIRELQICEVYGAYIDHEKILSEIAKLGYESLDTAPIPIQERRLGLEGAIVDDAKFDPSTVDPEEIKAYIIGGFMYNLKTENIHAPNLELWRPKQIN